MAFILARRPKLFRRGIPRACIPVLMAFGMLMPPLAAASTCSPPSCTPVFSSFGIDAIMGTLEVETAGGTVVYTANNLYVGTMIPDDMATQIETDSGVPAYIQNNIALLAGSNDFDFLTDPAGEIPSMLLSVDSSVGTVTGNEFTAVQNDLESIALAPVTSVTPTLVYDDAYFIAGFNSDQSEEAMGAINVGFYDDVVIETESAAVPEPGTALMVACGVLGLALFGRVRTRARFFGYFAVLAVLLNCAPKAFADTFPGQDCTAKGGTAECFTNAFNVNVYMGTLDVESAGGTVLYTANNLLVSNSPIPDDLAIQIETDSGVPAYVQNNIGLLAGSDDFDFIEEPGSDFPAMLLSVDGSVASATECSSAVCDVVEDDLESISLAPVTGVTATYYNDEYVIWGFNSDESELAKAAINVNFYSDVVVETETAAVPEPGTALMVACGVLGLALFRRVRGLRLGFIATRRFRSRFEESAVSHLCTVGVNPASDPVSAFVPDLRVRNGREQILIRYVWGPC